MTVVPLSSTAIRTKTSLVAPVKKLNCIYQIGEKTKFS